MVKNKRTTDRDDALTGSADRDKSVAGGEWAVAAVRARHFTQIPRAGHAEPSGGSDRDSTVLGGPGTVVSACRQEWRSVRQMIEATGLPLPQIAGRTEHGLL